MQTSLFGRSCGINFMRHLVIDDCGLDWLTAMGKEGEASDRVCPYRILGSRSPNCRVVSFVRPQRCKSCITAVKVHSTRHTSFVLLGSRLSIPRPSPDQEDSRNVYGIPISQDETVLQRTRLSLPSTWNPSPEPSIIP